MKVLKLQKSESLTLNIPVIITGKQTNVTYTWATPVPINNGLSGIYWL